MKLNNLLITIIIFSSILIIFYLKDVSNNEQKNYIIMHEKMNHSLELLKNDKNEEAKLMLKTIPNYEKVAIINYYLAIIFAKEQNYEQSALYFQKSIDLNPTIIGNEIVALQYGEVLFNINQYKIAYESFSYVKEFGKEEENIIKAESYLKRIKGEN